MRRLVTFLMTLVLAPGTLRAEWKQTSGPPGGEVYSLLASGNHIFASTLQGVYRSDSLGSTWERVLYRGEPDFYNSLVEMGRYILVGSTHASLLRTSDQGATWEPSDRGAEGLSVDMLGACGTSLLAAGQGRLYLSRDSGASWAPVPAALPTQMVSAFSALGRHCYVASEKGLYRTSDLGASWQHLYTDPVYSLGLSGRFLFAGTAFDGMLRSQDSGATWTAVNTGLFSDSAWNPTYDLRSIAASGGDLFVSTDVGMFRSSNNGATWEPATKGLLSAKSRPLIYVCAMAVKGSHVFAAYNWDSGIFRSSDRGQNWTHSSQGLVEASILAQTVMGGQLYAAVAAGAGIYRTGDNGSTWVRKGQGLLESEVYSLASRGAVLFAGTGNGIYRSLDSGATFLPANVGLSGNPEIGSLAVEGPDVFAVIGLGSVYRSRDDGASWTPASGGLPRAHLSRLGVSGTTLYAAFEDKGLYRSEDQGSSWTPVRGGLDTAGSFTAVAGEGALVFAGTDSGTVYRSADAGASWLPARLAAGATVTAFVIRGGVVFAATHRCVFRSSDQGRTWEQMVDGFPDEYQNVYSLASTATHLVAGLWAGGCWSIPLAEAAGIGPRRTAWDPRRPDSGLRFRPPGTIEFGISRAGWVNLSLHDARGIRAAKVVDAHLPPGWHRASLKAERLPPGSYYLLLREAGGTRVRKPVILR